MFFIAGVQPKTRILDGKPRLCPLCGLARARFRRVDHYLSFFFIPLLRVKKGEPFLTCDTCQREVGEMVRAGDIAQDLQIPACPGCGCELNPDFRFCPQCGRRLNPS